MKKKVGIITFHTAINYGVHLQAFALIQAATELGYEAHIIDYRKKTEKEAKQRIKNTNLYRIKNLRTIIGNKIYNNSNMQKIRREKFDEFDRKYLNLTKYCDDYVSISNEISDYFALICGSDQIWNPYQTHGNEVYFCRNIERKRRIAYAPSIGVDEIPNELKTVYGKLIGEIQYRSVREEAGKKILNNLGFERCEVVVDPTLLISENFWKKLSGKSKLDSLPLRYVVCYILGDQEIIDAVGEYYKDKDITVLNISQHYRHNRKSINVKDVYPGIEEFLALFERALAVYTDSFHGTMFSVIFKKNFYVYRREDTMNNLNSRIESFVNRVNLADRFLSRDERIEMKSLDYQKCQYVLSTWIDQSKKYLQDALRSIEGIS